MPGKHKSNGGRVLEHKHQYQLTRTRTELYEKEGEIVIFRFYVCINRTSPCPERDKVEIERRKLS